MDIEQLDKAVGQRLKVLRTEAGFTQQELAELCFISSQQIHKYESGRNRISAGKLVYISNAMGRPVQDFYSGLEHVSEEDYGRADLNVVRYFQQIKDEKCREAILQLMRQMAQENF